MTSGAGPQPLASLNAARRLRDLEWLGTGGTVELLVVGGGVTGTGVALDAASRGLKVALLERADLASGTSRWSSKLVHGGLRYLAHGEVGLAYASARERAVLMERTAPHLVRPLPMVIPLSSAVSRADAARIAAGLRAGDALRVAAGTRRATLPRSRRLSKVETLQLLPGLSSAGLRGGLLGWDGQLVDDARLVVALARTAASYGARVVTRCEVTALAGDGARVRDGLTGAEFDLRARAVVNATGVWAGSLASEIRLRPSRGSHLVVDSARLGTMGAAAVTVPLSPSQYVFALPQRDGRRSYVGITDVPASRIDDVPQPDPDEIDFLLSTINSVLESPLRPEDVLGAFSGLRPLLDDPRAGARTTDLSRRHAVVTGSGGVVTVVGGKITTYREMAEDAVDTAVAVRGLVAGPCRTRSLSLVGAAGTAQLDRLGGPRRLVQRYGTEAAAVLAEAGGDPALTAPLADGVDVTGAELLFGLRHEGALDADDLLDRRTRIGLVTADRARLLPIVQELVLGV
jgi:glycerol-3-phosphate dehydrogenase